MDASIAQMVAFTDTTPERAAQYLQLTDGDVNQAVSLFFENGGADLIGTSSTATATSTARQTNTGNATNPISLDDDNISDDNDPEVTGFQKDSSRPSGSQKRGAETEDDEAMARRLQEEMYGAGGAEEPVRAPIARQAETLLGPNASYYSGPALNTAVEERMQAFSDRRGRRGPSIFNQQPTSRIWAEGSEREALAESTGGASEASSRAGYLARLFAPNWSLMYEGTWDEARDLGKSEKKWLLVNIQNEKVFDCQVLNRDIWKDKGIVDTVQENFVFLQYSKDDPRADQYCQFYFHNAEIEDEYPHIAVVDPRTGEQMKLWSKKIPGPSEFLMQLHEFLDRYSLESNVRNPVAKRKPEFKEKSVEMLSEEEQLERALAASLAASGSGLKTPAADPDDLTRSISDLKGKGVEDVPTNNASTAGNRESEESGPFASIPADRPHVEPAMGPTVTRIQLRHPAGRLVRRFDVADPVQRIYEFLKAEPFEGRTGVDFELVAMGKNLIGSLEQSIGEAGLKNGTVMIEFMEEA